MTRDDYMRVFGLCLQLCEEDPYARVTMTVGSGGPMLAIHSDRLERGGLSRSILYDGGARYEKSCVEKDPGFEKTEDALTIALSGGQ